VASAELVFNGIDGLSGDYLVPPMSAPGFTAVLQGDAPPEHAAELRRRKREDTTDVLAPKEGVDASNLSETGWGVVFAHGADPAIREALAPLLAHRQEQASGERPQRYRELSGDVAYRPGETKGQFLARQGAGPGPVDPDVLPYYLLLVGDPGTIPYPFQYQLDVAYAVGRLHFGSPEEYHRYAT